MSFKKYKIIEYYLVLLSFLSFKPMDCGLKTMALNIFDFENLRYKFFKNIINNFHVVERGKLYRSCQLSASDLTEYIKKYKLKTVINLRGEAKDKKWFLDEQRVAKKLNISFFSIPMSAKSLSTKENLNKLLKLYETAPKPILIHCQSGADRTGEAAALWVLEVQQKDKKKAKKQLSIQYLHFKNKYPAKDFLIKIWQGKDWFYKSYDPKKYEKF